MKFLVKFEIIAILSLLLAVSAFGQAFPNAPSIPSRILDMSLPVMDGVLRGMDGKTTHTLAANPCNCFYEADPFAPSGKSELAVAVFQGGMWAAAIESDRYLSRHNHKWYGRLVMVADIVSESIAVANNKKLEAGKIDMSHPQPIAVSLGHK